MTEFEQFSLDPGILQSLDEMGFKEPTPIQKEAIPLILQKRDLIALAQTGSGKTATCAIPVCNHVNVAHKYIQALVIVPTRELALQFVTEAQKIGKRKGIKAFAIFGGEDASMQLSKLKHGVQLLVATPGRLIDFIYSRNIDLSHVDTLVLDEADEMLSMGFYDDLEFIIQCLVHEHQTLLFSATMPKQIRSIAKQHMKDPAEITLTSKHASPPSIRHEFLYCKHFQRDAALLKLIQELNPRQCIVFCGSRHQTEKVCKELKNYLDGVDYLHAGLSQDVRTIVTNKFRSERIRILVATDVAARGLDFSHVTHVVIYQLGDDVESYVHRSGRTGRNDRHGTVISLVTDRELGALRNVLKHIQKEPIWIGDSPKKR